MTSSMRSYKPSTAGGRIGDEQSFSMRSTQSLSQRHTLRSNEPDAGLELYASEFLDTESDLPKRSFGEVHRNVMTEWWKNLSKTKRTVFITVTCLLVSIGIIAFIVSGVLKFANLQANEQPFGPLPPNVRPVRYDNMTIPLGTEEAKLWIRNDFAAFWPNGIAESVDPRGAAVSTFGKDIVDNGIQNGTLISPEGRMDAVRESWINYVDKLTDRPGSVNPVLEERIRDVTYEPIAYGVATSTARPLYTTHPTLPDYLKASENADYFVWPKKSEIAGSHDFGGLYSKWVHYSGDHKIPTAVVGGKECQPWSGTVSQLVENLKQKLEANEVTVNDLDCYKMTGYIEKYDDSLKLPVAHTPTYNTGVIGHQTTSYARVNNATVNS